MSNDNDLTAALTRLGRERPTNDAKSLRRHLSLQPGVVPEDEILLMALGELHNAMVFQSDPKAPHRLRIPEIVHVADGGVGRWVMRIERSLGKGFPSIVVEASLPKRGRAILRAMATTGDATLDLDELVAQADALRDRVAESLDGFVGGMGEALDRDVSRFEGDEEALYRKTLNRTFGKRSFPFEGALDRMVRKSFDNARREALQVARERQRERLLRERLGIGSYVERYTLARSLGRRIVFHVGPTNSGKTYAALQALAAAPTGVYLAPLRLLALENYEAMKAMGLAAGMVTGEEEMDVEGATHLAQTVETLDIRRQVDVAVIDEVQMLADDDRGWAWTNALFGVPARTVIVCGAEEALGRVRLAAEAAGEELQVVRFERKSPLHVQDGEVRFRDVRQGDAIVAFSRRAVHEIRLRVAAEGHSVATVYGALSPEVRRAEAARFRSGEADVLVTTDAIGMGLNLGPLRRVVFADLVKWDGTQERQLTNAEIRQIAGRAGRYGFHDSGEVAAMVPGGATRIRHALATGGDAGGRRFYARPDAEALRMVADEMGSDSLRDVLTRFSADTFYKGSPFMPSNLEETIEIATMLDKVRMPLEDRFAFAISPIDRRDGHATWCLRSWAGLHAIGRSVPAPPLSAFGGLGVAEAGVRIASAYLWLARRFPATFDDVESAKAARAAGNDAIEAELRDTAVARVARAAKA